MLDFLLFENYHLAYHHKMDVVIIAKMLKSQGLNVAIFDIYHEDHIDGIPVLHWDSQQKVPNDVWMTYPHSLMVTLGKGWMFQIQQHRYMKEVKKYIYDKANAFYCGSYHNGISTVLFGMKKPCYWWGLRSDRLKLSLRKFMYNPLLWIGILRERRVFMRNPMQWLFVSNISHSYYYYIGVS